MSSITTESRLTQFRTAGSREWWFGYLFGPLLLLGLGLALFPRVVYDQFIWQYLWGPVVADAANQQVTHNSVTAVKGYNAVNTATYLVVVLYALSGLREFLAAFKIDLTTRLAYGIAPIIIAGGAMRALEDASVLGAFDVLFITPSIYFVIAGVTLGGLGIGAVLRNRGIASIPLTVGALGSIWAVLAIGWAIQYGITSGETFRPIVPVLTLGIALLVTGGFYLAGSVTGWSVLHHPMYLLVIFGQMWDGAQNLVGVSLYSYTPKMFITQKLYHWTGFQGSTFFVKLLVVIVLVWILADGDDERSHEQWWVIAMAVVVVGLPMGVRGTIRMMLGV